MLNSRSSGRSGRRSRQIRTFTRMVQDIADRGIGISGGPSGLLDTLETLADDTISEDTLYDLGYAPNQSDEKNLECVLDGLADPSTAEDYDDVAPRLMLLFSGATPANESRPFVFGNAASGRLDAVVYVAGQSREEYFLIREGSPGQNPFSQNSMGQWSVRALPDALGDAVFARKDAQRPIGPKDAGDA